jgi:hypothetical protein
MSPKLLLLAALAAASLAVVAQAGIIDHYNSAVCVSTLPQCQAKCRPPSDYIFVCSAGGGIGGAPLINCQCVVPTAPGGGDQKALITLVDFPGGQKCKQKTWVNDCGTNMIASVTGSTAAFTPTITQAFGNPCVAQQGIVTGTNKVVVTFPEYPLGIMTSNRDGSISIQFGAFDDGSTNCYAIYKIVQGNFMNGTYAQAGMGLPGAMGMASTTDGTNATGAAQTLAALLNSAHPTGMPSLLLSAAMLLLCLLGSMAL